MSNRVTIPNFVSQSILRSPIDHFIHIILIQYFLDECCTNFMYINEKLRNKEILIRDNKGHKKI